MRSPSLGRRGLLAGGIAAATRIVVARPSSADDTSADPERTGVDAITPETQRAIDRGLKFLAEQQRDDGSFGFSGYSRNVAVCGLAGLAFIAAGSTPGRGPYGGRVNRCVDFIVGNAQDGGFINVHGTTTHGPMYGHGFATLFLAEVYGMAPADDVREKLSRAVKLIVNTQNDEGGWRYQPERREADISVTVCQIMALRAARNAGLFVPNETIDRCVGYVKRSQNADGGFMYTLRDGGPSAFPRSAAGVVALYSAGIYEGRELESGIAYLLDNAPPSGEEYRESHYFYGHYYAAQAMWHAGGDHWRTWYPSIRDELVARQRGDGAWMDSICPEYGTSMACITLQIPNNYLPILQR